jgi:hypothetical protein
MFTVFFTLGLACQKNVHDLISIIFEFKWTRTMKMCMWKRAMTADLQVVTKNIILRGPNYSSIHLADQSSIYQEQRGRKVGIESYKKIKIPLIPKSRFC